MSTKFELLALPELTQEFPSNRLDCVVNAIGEIFQTVHELFARMPEKYERLSAGAMFVPLYAAEQMDQQHREEGTAILSVLFANLDYPFSEEEFLTYLSGKQGLPIYEQAMHPGQQTDSFWSLIGPFVQQAEFERLMTAINQLLCAFAATKIPEELEQICRLCNLARMEHYCTAAEDAGTEFERLTQCYNRAMQGDQELSEQERSFFLSALIYYSVAESGDHFFEGENRLWKQLMLSPEEFLDMYHASEPRGTLDALYQCTGDTAGEFWKTLYAAAHRINEDDLVAETAVYLQALVACLTGGPSRQQTKRNQLFALVV